MKDLIESAMLLGLILLLIFACSGASIALSRKAGESKPTLNLCSAESIQIGEDIEYVYVKVKK